LAALVAAKLPV